MSSARTPPPNCNAAPNTFLPRRQNRLSAAESRQECSLAMTVLTKALLTTVLRNTRASRANRRRTVCYLRMLSQTDPKSKRKRNTRTTRAVTRKERGLLNRQACKRPNQGPRWSNGMLPVGVRRLHTAALAIFLPTSHPSKSAVAKLRWKLSEKPKPFPKQNPPQPTSPARVQAASLNLLRTSTTGPREAYW